MIKAYSYIRFSSTRQMRGDSLRRQTELSEQYAKEHNLELDQISIFVISACPRLMAQTSNVVHSVDFLRLLKLVKFQRVHTC